MKRIIGIAVAMLLMASMGYAQGTDRAAAQQQSYNRIKGLVMGSVNEMPDGGFTSRPMAEVTHEPVAGIRNFAQIFGHIADFHYGTCAQARGVDNPMQGMSLEDQLVGATKQQTIDAIAESYAFCDPAFESLTEASAAEIVAGGRGGPTARGAILNRILEHDNEMYGISTVYLRTFGEVPPASQGRGRGGRGGAGRGGQ